MREMGETSVQDSFCDGGNLNGSIDESVEFVRLRVRSVSKTDSKDLRLHFVTKLAPLVMSTFRSTNRSNTSSFISCNNFTPLSDSPLVH